MYVNTWTLYIGGGCINYLNQQIYFTPQHHTRAGRQKKVILRATIIRATAKILNFFLHFYVKFHKNQPGTGLHVWPSYVMDSRENCLQIFVIVMIQLVPSSPNTTQQNVYINPYITFSFHFICEFIV